MKACSFFKNKCFHCQQNLESRFKRNFTLIRFFLLVLSTFKVFLVDMWNIDRFSHWIKIFSTTSSCSIASRYLEVIVLKLINYSFLLNSFIVRFDKKSFISNCSESSPYKLQMKITFVFPFLGLTRTVKSNYTWINAILLLFILKHFWCSAGI